MKQIATRGFTLMEMLLVVVILGIVAGAMIPFLSSNDPQKLNVAAEETANFLRFAVSEAKRNQTGYVLVDGKTTSGRLALYTSNATAALTSAINDPLTKRTAVLNVNQNAFSQGVTLTPQFRAGGNPQSQLLIRYDATGALQLQGFNGVSGGQGVLQANSGLLLSLGAQSITVRINEVTGMVTLP